MALISRKFFLNRNKTPGYLEKLEEANTPDTASLYLPAGASAPEIEVMLGKAGVISSPEELVKSAAGSKTGAAIFWGSERKCLVLPPFPIKEKATFNGYVTGPLCLLLSTDFKIGLILVHLGTYAIGVCAGEKLITSKVGTGLVHGRHKKGGSSQQRFQRRRQNQALEFLDRVCTHAKEELEPQVKQLDYIVYGGPHHTVLLFQKRCPFLKSFEDRTLPLLDVPSLRQKVLEATVSRVWASSITEWREE